MNTSTSGAIFSAVGAAVLYIIIAIATGGSAGKAIGIGAAIGVVVFVISIIGRALIRRSKRS